MACFQNANRVRMRVKRRKKHAGKRESPSEIGLVWGLTWTWSDFAYFCDFAQQSPCACVPRKSGALAIPCSLLWCLVLNASSDKMSHLGRGMDIAARNTQTCMDDNP